MKKIILASGSPRRKMLLEWAEIPFDVVVSDADESFDATMPPVEIAIAIAQKKNAAVVNNLKDDAATSIVISADTIVVLHGEVIGKPVNRDDAIGILKRLSNQTHQVITAVCVRNKKQEKVFHDITLVCFHPLSDEQITHYVDFYKPYDKAGAYAIQEWIGVVGIKSIQGDFYNVMGLPVSRLLHTLQEAFL